MRSIADVELHDGDRRGGWELVLRHISTDRAVVTDHLAATELPLRASSVVYRRNRRQLDGTASDKVGILCFFFSETVRCILVGGRGF